jgi:hypothetical protein
MAPSLTNKTVAQDEEVGMNTPNFRISTLGARQLDAGNLPADVEEPVL